MAAYTTRLSIPLVGLSGEMVLSEIRAAVAKHGPTDCELDLQQRPPIDDWHVHVVVRMSAPSTQAAHELARRMHDRALQRVLAAGEVMGWTSGFDHPEPAGPADMG